MRPRLKTVARDGTPGPDRDLAPSLGETLCSVDDDGFGWAVGHSELSGLHRREPVAVRIPLLTDTLVEYAGVCLARLRGQDDVVGHNTGGIPAGYALPCSARHRSSSAVDSDRVGWRRMVQPPALWG
jgi:hypothetical protein